MWSVGCILAELLGRQPLFPGSDYVGMLRMIVNACGSPNKEVCHFVPGYSYVRRAPGRLIRLVGVTGVPSNWREICTLSRRYAFQQGY